MAASRKLTSEETELLRGVFGESVDYTKVRVHDRHWAAEIAGVGAFVFGNNIQISSKHIGNSRILIHETAHVWQFQNEHGWNYFFKAVRDHVTAFFDKHNPYDYSKVEGKVPWSEWSIEQQAEWIGDHASLPGTEIINART